MEGNVNRWEKTVHETEEALQQKQNEEQKAKGDVERLMQLFDTMKKEISEFKQEIDKKVFGPFIHVNALYVFMF